MDETFAKIISDSGSTAFADAIVNEIRTAFPNQEARLLFTGNLLARILAEYDEPYNILGRAIATTVVLIPVYKDAITKEQLGETIVGPKVF